MRAYETLHSFVQFDPKLPMHGLLGTLSFAGHVASLLPMLRMGQYIHIGAGTAFGLGRYRLHTSPV
jgi:CRISPR/Cas system endoribonuclease Cas6 (RAMP superfamily)